MQDEIRALVTRHCSTLKAEMAAVSRNMERLSGESPVAVDQALSGGIEAAHKIKGSSGSIGFKNISDAAALLEASLRRVRDSGRYEEPIRTEVEQEVLALHDLVEHVRPEDSSLFAADFSAFAR